MKSLHQLNRMSKSDLASYLLSMTHPELNSISRSLEIKRWTGCSKSSIVSAVVAAQDHALYIKEQKELEDFFADL